MVDTIFELRSKAFRIAEMIGFLGRK